MGEVRDAEELWISFQGAPVLLFFIHLWLMSSARAQLPGLESLTSYEKDGVKGSTPVRLKGGKGLLRHHHL